MCSNVTVPVVNNNVGVPPIEYLYTSAKMSIFDAFESEHVIFKLKLHTPPGINVVLGEPESVAKLSQLFALVFPFVVTTKLCCADVVAVADNSLYVGLPKAVLVLLD